MAEISNKKILNAKLTSYNDINFKSKLEVACYKKLAASGLSFAYEPETIIIWQGNKITNTVGYFPDKNKMLVPKTNYKLRDITYTPDFKIVYKGYTIYIDSKGHVNDVYPLKKKMFLQYLNNKVKHLFFEPHSVKQMVQTIDIIKKL